MTFENNTNKTDRELLIEILEYSIKIKHEPYHMDLSDQKALLRVLKEGGESCIKKS
jgi:hypothetical protein